MLWVFCCIEISLFPSPRQNYGMSMSNSVTSENIRDGRDAHLASKPASVGGAAMRWALLLRNITT